VSRLFAAEAAGFARPLTQPSAHTADHIHHPGNLYHQRINPISFHKYQYATIRVADEKRALSLLSEPEETVICCMALGFWSRRSDRPFAWIIDVLLAGSTGKTLRGMSKNNGR
jgi:hypothetical protein